MLPGGPLLPFNPAISFLPKWQDSFSQSYLTVAKWKNSIVISAAVYLPFKSGPHSVH